MGDCPRGHGAQEQLVDHHGEPPLRKRAVHSDVQKIRQPWQEASMDVQGTPS